MSLIRSTAACAAALLCASLAVPASAAIVTTHLKEDISTTPYTIDFGTVGSVTFSTVSPDITAPDGVQTSGGVQVYSAGFPYPSPTPDTFSFGIPGHAPFPDGELGSFASFSTPTAIPYSGTEGLIGLGITEADGLHYAFVDLHGSQINGYAFATVAGEGLPYVSITAVPEPGVWMLMLSGLAGVGMMLRRNRRPALASVTA